MHVDALLNTLCDTNSGRLLLAPNVYQRWYNPSKSNVVHSPTPTSQGMVNAASAAGSMTTSASGNHLVGLDEAK